MAVHVNMSNATTPSASSRTTAIASGVARHCTNVVTGVMEGAIMQKCATSDARPNSRPPTKHMLHKASTPESFGSTRIGFIEVRNAIFKKHLSYIIEYIC